MERFDTDESRIISYACSYLPEEIILAAGMTPRRIIPKARPTKADAHIHPNTCHYIKSLLAEGLDEGRPAGEIFIVANSCDGMRRLHDLWNEYVKTPPALFVDVPKKNDQDSIEFFSSELRKLAEKLESDFGCAKATDERLSEAIISLNTTRALMNEVHRLQAAPGSSVSGMSVFDLYMESASLHPAAFADRAREFISEAGAGKPAKEGNRIVLTGNVIYRPDLIAMIEDSGGRVVVVDTCLGARHFDSLVDEDSQNPMRALAKRYLTRASCARMQGLDERIQRLKRLAADSGADGVIYSAVKFCDTHMYDIPSMRDEFKQAGIPFLFLENDYEWSGLGQMRVRIEAFLAMVGGGEVSARV